MDRRLPVYLLLDVSASMIGEPIEAIRQGIAALLADLRDDPQALETVWISVITFHSRAQQITPLTPLGSFRAPPLLAGGQSSFGAALRLLDQCLLRETTPADWRPLIFVMTDGTPTDEWEPAAGTLRNRQGEGLIACAAGSEADRSTLRSIASAIVDLSRLRPDDLRAYFQWVSVEVAHAAGS